jgi:hypothetical protein
VEKFYNNDDCNYAGIAAYGKISAARLVPEMGSWVDAGQPDKNQLQPSFLSV